MPMTRPSFVLFAVFTVLMSGAASMIARPKITPVRRAPEHQTGTLNVNHTTLYYETFGSGTPILVLHGGPGMDHTYFLPQMLSLSRRYKLIFMDERASGKSSADVDSSSMNMHMMVEDVEAVRVALHLGKVNLMGHSWGGLLAMRYVLAHPDNVKSLMLVDPTPATSAMRDSSFQNMRHHMTVGDSINLAKITASEEFRKGSPATYAKFFRSLFRPLFADTTKLDSLTLEFPSDYAARSKAIQFLYRDPTLKSYDLTAGLRDLRCRALIIAGDHDQVPPGAFEQIHYDLSGSRLVIIKDCGHFPFIEAPQEFDAAVERFLR